MLYIHDPVTCAKIGRYGALWDSGECSVAQWMLGELGEQCELSLAWFSWPYDLRYLARHKTAAPLVSFGSILPKR